MPLLGPAEVAKWLGVSVAWVRDHATRKSPRLPAIKAGKLLRFRPCGCSRLHPGLLACGRCEGEWAPNSKAYAVPVVHTRLKPGRERGQNGWLQITGKTRKRWRGHFYTYEPGPDGNEVRRHRSVLLAYRSEMTRKQAEEALRQAIAARAETKIDERPKVTFDQFWRERYLPLYEQNWKASSRQTQIDNIERYCVTLLKDMPLAQIDRFQLQKIANGLAQKFSASVVAKFVTWSRAILEEAVDQEFLSKNPARKLTIPETRAENKRFLRDRRDPTGFAANAISRGTSSSHHVGARPEAWRVVRVALERRRGILASFG